jgi:hypothetical protein
LLLVAAIGGCAGSRDIGPTGNTGRFEVDENTLRPTVRSVPLADMGTLWKAAHDYMERLFPLDVNDGSRRAIETRTLEWEVDRAIYRARITVQVIVDPDAPENAKLGVLARVMRPRYYLEDAQEGEPLRNDWAVVGNHADLEQFVATKIVERYLLLRQGRDPDEVQDLTPPEGMQKKG